MRVQFFRGVAPPPTRSLFKISEGKKRAKFGEIWDNFRLWPWISGKNRDINKQKTAFSPALNETNLVSFGSQTQEITRLMFTYPKSNILRMLMHLISRHVTLLQGNFLTPWTFPPIGLTAPVKSRWALPKISSSLFFGVLSVCYNPVPNNAQAR